MPRVGEYIFVFAFLLLCPVSEAQSEKTSPSLRVMTYNIKYDNKQDTINGWHQRRDQVIGLIRYHQPDVFGVQEALVHQLEDIKAALPRFDFVGVGRDDGEQIGEYTALFYHKDKMIVKNSGTFWLSETTSEPSKGWDAAYPRTCTWVRLKIPRLDNDFFVFNTHLDNVGEEARLESIQLILKEMIRTTQNLPTILMGDFNFTPEAPSYSLVASQMSDAKKISEQSPYGSNGTFNGFKFLEKPSRRIDYLFVNERCVVSSYAVLTDSEDMRYPSDHFPVITTIEID